MELVLKADAAAVNAIGRIVGIYAARRVLLFDRVFVGAAFAASWTSIFSAALTASALPKCGHTAGSITTA